MYKSKIVEGLEELYKPLGNDWVNNNAFILGSARRCELAIGGSIGMAIGRKCVRKIPGDIDLFNDDYSKSLAFLSEVVEFLSNKIESIGYKVQFNNNTKFTLPGVSHHIRISVPFWKPICVMTLKSSLRVYFFKGLMVQDYRDIKAAAETIEKIDGKQRTDVPVCGTGPYMPLITTTEITPGDFIRSRGMVSTLGFTPTDRYIQQDNFLS